jgi:hypothetical protein
MRLAGSGMVKGYVQLSGSLLGLVRLSRVCMHVAPYIWVPEYSSIQNYIVDLQVRYGGEGRYESLRQVS